MPNLFTKITDLAGKSSRLPHQNIYIANRLKSSVDISLPHELELEAQIVMDAAADFGVRL
jgi:hypothetical protein